MKRFALAAVILAGCSSSHTTRTVIQCATQGTIVVDVNRVDPTLEEIVAANAAVEECRTRRHDP